jgi:hypothetical protein
MIRPQVDDEPSQVQTTGTAITKVLPPVSRFAAGGGHGEKKQRVLTKLSTFFERFFGLSSTGTAMGNLLTIRRAPNLKASQGLSMPVLSPYHPVTSPSRQNKNGKSSGSPRITVSSGLFLSGVD